MNGHVNHFTRVCLLHRQVSLADLADQQLAEEQLLKKVQGPRAADLAGQVKETLKMPEAR